MALKKSELYSSLWKACDELRGKMDASQYKDYVLTLLFIKYVSDKYAGKEYANVEIPQGASFEDMVKLKGKSDIGDAINKKILAPIAEANDLGGLKSSVDFNDEAKLGKGKEMVDRLTRLIAIFEDERLDFSKNKAEGDDLLGDAYEYLMRHFATESGKSKGQFYTPSEVSMTMAHLIDIKNAKSQEATLYDPTCGSGSLLLKAAGESTKGVTIYGQEMDNATTTLAKMNMFIHEYPGAEIINENTLSTPFFKDERDTSKLKTFDFIVANPPFSAKSWTNGFNPDQDDFGRFKDYGVPPKKNGDYAFLLHIVKSLKSTGKAAVILPHGVLFRGNKEADIRKNLIKRGFIKGIIGLPANLFYGTGIPACIIVIDKENAESRKGIFMIDASKGFYKDGNKNRLRSRDMHKIVDVFTKGLEVEKYSRMVPTSEITDEKNDYNLNIPRYIDSQEEEDVQDIEAHLKGDIPKRDVDALQDYWNFFPQMRNQLFENKKNQNYMSLKVVSDEINKTISESTEFEAYAKEVRKKFNEWKNKNEPTLTNLKEECTPKELISKLSEDLLQTFSNGSLIDKYAIYQNLMNYWAEVMQDDAYMISLNGWKAEITDVTTKKGKKIGWECDLIPKPLTLKKYFSAQEEKIREMQESVSQLDEEMNTLEEEHEEEDTYSEVRGNNGKISVTSIKKRMKEIKDDAEFSDEQNALDKYATLLEKSATLKKEIKKEEAELDKKLLKRYTELTGEEIKEIVIYDKWLTAIQATIEEEIEGVNRSLTNRIKELAKRYDQTLPELEKSAEELHKKVDDHLKKMGFTWK